MAVHLITLDGVLCRGEPISTASRITAKTVELGKSESGYPKLHRPETWQSAIKDAADGAIDPPAFAGHVLSAWHAIYEARIEEWTTRTLEALYGPANRRPG